MITIKKRNEQGFLLMDAVVSMLILTIALLAISGVVMSARTLSGTNDDRTQAYKLGQSSMEKLKQVPSSTWKTLIATSDTAYKTVGPSIGTVALPASDGKFTCIYSAKISSAANTGNHLVQVRAVVTWTARTQAGTNQSNTVELIGYCERQDP